MFRHLLVPLDGSSLAEAVVPAAAWLAAALHARVTLIHIIESDAPTAVHGDRHLTDSREAAAYLEKVKQRHFPADIIVACHVHQEPMNNVTQGIVLHQDELSPDLILMATHGRSGLRGLLFGRIAQQVASSGHLPVLMFQPGVPSVAEPFACRRILVPVDGRPGHGAGLETGSRLAGDLHSRLDLLTVVPTTVQLTGTTAVSSRFAPGTSQAMLEITESNLLDFLKQQADTWSRQGIHVETHLERGAPASTIVDMAATLASDLIVLGTHGRSGTTAFWTQSIGAKVLARASRPVLLVPAGLPPGQESSQ
jgi:nucleotide-binding universal stress UspA family protein